MLVVAGLLAISVAVFGSLRAADGTSSTEQTGDATSTTAGTPDADAPVPEDDAPAGGDDVTDGDAYEGSLEPVRAGPARFKEPIGLDDRTEFPVGLAARVADVEAVKGSAHGPGEIAGPALRVTIRAANQTAKSISLDNTMFVVSYGKNMTPGIMLTGPGTKPFPTAVAAGDAVTGTYVFNIPPENRNRIQVSLTYSATEPTAVFEGPVQ